MRNSTGAAWAETRNVTPGTSSSDAARIGKSEYLMLKYEVISRAANSVHLSRLWGRSARSAGWGLSQLEDSDSWRHRHPSPPPQERERGRSSVVAASRSNLIR